MGNQRLRRKGTHTHARTQTHLHKHITHRAQQHSSTTPHHHTPHHTTLHHTTAHHTRPHHTTPNHATAHHVTSHHTTPRDTTHSYNTPGATIFLIGLLIGFPSGSLVAPKWAPMMFVSCQMSGLLQRLGRRFVS